MTTEQTTMKKTTSTANSNSGLQSCKKVSDVQGKINFVPVARFRKEYDHVLRVANSDYHACVGEKEINNWLGIAARVLSELIIIDCKRASEADRRWYRLAIESVRSQIEKAEIKIAQIKIDKEYKSFSRNQRDTINGAGNN